MSDIPRGWATATIGEVSLAITGGGTPSKSVAGNFSGSIPFMTVKDMKTYRPLSTQDKITKEALTSSSSNLIPAGVPIVSTRMGLGKIVIVDFPTAINQDLKAIILNSKVINVSYFEYWYRSIFKVLNEMGTGTTVKGITLKQLQSLRLPLPSLNEQIEISRKLDELLSCVKSLKLRLDALPLLLKRLRQSVFDTAASGNLTSDWRSTCCDAGIAIDSLMDVEKTRRGVPDDVKFPEILDGLKIPENWIWVSAAKLLKKGLLLDLKDGNHGSNHPKTSEFTPEGLPFITAASVSNNGTIDYITSPKISGEALARLRVGFSVPGDVIFTHKGTVGRVAINSEKCVLTPQTTYYRTNKEFLQPEYLSLFLQSDKFTSQTNEIKSQTTRDFIPIKAQYELFHVIPPISEQIEIARRAGVLLLFSDQLEIKINAARHHLNRISQSIFIKAFQGGFTEKWREDNSELSSGENSALFLLGRAKSDIQAIKENRKTPIRIKSLKDNSMSKVIRKVSATLSAAKVPMTGQQLLEAAGYPQDSTIEELEAFFLDLRDSLEEKTILKLPRDTESQDWFVTNKASRDGL